jgi:tripartite-type tricarboxylate transporter receptor subunit TctC
MRIAMRKAFVALCLAFGLAANGAGHAQAQNQAQNQAQADDYPTRNITFICPFPAGGGTDILVRLLAAELQDKLKRPVIVDNRPGAGTVIAASAVAKSPPDGYTLFLAPVTTLAIGPSIYKKLPYDTVKDFAPVGLVGSAQFALVANPNIGAPTLPDLIALVKSKNGQMSYGTSGASTPHHLFMEMFLKMIGAKAQHVPYRGSVPALTDVISGQIPFMMVDLAAAMGAIRKGKVKAYGVTSANRIKAMPELPTIAEAGLPGFAATGWFSVVVPAHTPRPIIDKLNGVMMAYLKKPEVQDKLNALAITPLTSTPDELEKFIPAEIAKWAKVVQDAGIQPQ